MTTHVPPVDTAPPAVETERKTYLNVSSGFMSWAGTLDHKRIGIMYLIGTSAALLAGGLFALLVRLHLWEPEGLLFTNQQPFRAIGAIVNTSGIASQCDIGSQFVKLTTQRQRIALVAFQRCPIMRNDRIRDHKVFVEHGF